MKVKLRIDSQVSEDSVSIEARLMTESIQDRRDWRDFHRSLLLHDCFLFLQSSLSTASPSLSYRPLLFDPACPCFPHHALLHAYLVYHGSYFQMEWKLLPKRLEHPALHRQPLWRDDSNLCTFG